MTKDILADFSDDRLLSAATIITIHYYTIKCHSTLL
jgi:hypothetical protein